MARSRSPRNGVDPSRRAGRRLIALVVALGLGAAAGDAGRARFDRWIDATALPPLGVAVGTEVVARDGSLLRAFQVGNGIWRLAPPATGVDEGYLAMLLAWEDRRFREHHGVDGRAVLRAAAQGIRHGRVVSGASTLSMQVARLLEQGPTGDWHGKIRQARVAMALERRVGKDGILALYLRLAPYGGNVEGVRAASLMWFGKEPRRLTPAEAALLVALPQSPEVRRPDRRAGRAAARIARDRVLARARAAGLIDAEAEATARATPLPDHRRAFPALAPLLAERLARENPGAPRIETTIDPALQRAAEAAVARAVRDQSDRVSAAALIADHRSGEILASVGTALWSDQPSAGFIDMTRSLRSPGSTLKPFVYALGFDDGLIHPETLIEDRPATFGRWQPVNFDRRFRGTVTVRQALTESLNIPVVRVAAVLGPARVAAVLRQSGMRLSYAGGVPGLALVLGGGGVSLQDLVQGYAALGQGGVAVRLHDRPEGTVQVPPGPAGMGVGPVVRDGTRVEATPTATASTAPNAGAVGGRAVSATPPNSPTDHVMTPAAAGGSTAAGGGQDQRAREAKGTRPGDGGLPDAGARVFSPVAAWYVSSILSHIPPPNGAETGRVAYKTGTSYGHRDALAIGYDGGFVAGVWLGRPDGTPVPGAFGGERAAPVLFDLFDALGPAAVPLPPPPADALTLTTARLPVTLRRFTTPGETPVPFPRRSSPTGTAAPPAIAATAATPAVVRAAGDQSPALAGLPATDGPRPDLAINAAAGTGGTVIDSIAATGPATEAAGAAGRPGVAVVTSRPSSVAHDPLAAGTASAEPGPVAGQPDRPILAPEPGPASPAPAPGGPEGAVHGLASRTEGVEAQAVNAATPAGPGVSRNTAARPAAPPTRHVETLSILFPPEGAEVELSRRSTLPARLRGGVPPYVWLLNGVPVARSVSGESAMLPTPGPGYAALSVVDAAGRSQRVGFSVRLVGAR